MSSFFLTDLPNWLFQKYFHTNTKNMTAYNEVLKQNHKTTWFRNGFGSKPVLN